MEEKYYTPSIEEFHIGFEYEETINNTPFRQEADISVKRIFSNRISNRTDELTCIDYDLGSGGYNVRVKCLDMEDIESFGWILDEVSTKYGNCLRFNINGGLSPKNGLDGFWIDVNKNNNSSISINKVFGNEFTIDGHKYKTIFDGYIKNKSELKKLLKQLSIC